MFRHFEELFLPSKTCFLRKVGWLLLEELMCWRCFLNCLIVYLHVLVHFMDEFLCVSNTNSLCVCVCVFAGRLLVSNFTTWNYQFNIL